jgi:hypothetical protein
MKNQEIDLLEIFIKIYGFIKKRFIYLGVAVIVGFLFGFGLNKLEKKQYETSVLLRATAVNNQTMVDIANNISQALKKNNYPYLSKNLHLEKPFIEKIESFKAEINPDVKEPNCLSLSLTYFDSSAVRGFLSAVFKYIENNEYLQEKYEQEKENTNEIIKKLKIEIAELDSFQNMYKKSLSQYKNASHSQIVNLSSTHNDIINLFEKQRNLSEKMKLLEKPYIIINDVIYPNKPSNNSLKKNVVIYSVLFLFIGIFVLVFIEAIRFLNAKSK